MCTHPRWAVTMTLIRVYFLLLAMILGPAMGNTAASRSPKRIHIPFLGLGPRCTGCPPNFCDDDPDIVYGYCCGCARFFDFLPVECPPRLDCPINNYDLCESYEYMMHCCCS